MNANAFGLCATSSETSKLLSVVNIARRNADGSWHGDMLDSSAFVAAMQSEGGSRLERARVFQVGAGGAGSAIAIALLDAAGDPPTLTDDAQTPEHQSQCRQIDDHTQVYLVERFP
jgi:shikimate 5-dehydrogenase